MLTSVFLKGSRTKTRTGKKSGRKRLSLLKLLEKQNPWTPKSWKIKELFKKQSMKSAVVKITRNNRLSQSPTSATAVAARAGSPSSSGSIRVVNVSVR